MHGGVHGCFGCAQPVDETADLHPQRAMAPKPAHRSFKQHRKHLGNWITKRIKLLGGPEEEEGRSVSTTPDMPDVPCAGLGPGPLDAHNPRKQSKLSYQTLEAARRTPVSDIVEGDQTDALRR